MALWKKEFCPFCGTKVGLFNYRIQDNIAVCRTCFAKADLDVESFKLMNIDTLSECYEKRKKDLELFRQFRATNEVKIGGLFGAQYFREDEKLGVWYVSSSKNPENPTLFRHEELAHFELFVDGNSVSSGGLGRAAVGGILFGRAGAVVGAVTGEKVTKKEITSLYVMINLNNPYRKKIKIDCMNWDDDEDMEDAHNLMMFLHGIKARANVTPISREAPTEVSAADEILKFKNLLDMGVISEEEFITKKKQLLGV